MSTGMPRSVKSQYEETVRENRSKSLFNESIRSIRFRFVSTLALQKTSHTMERESLPSSIRSSNVDPALS